MKIAVTGFVKNESADILSWLSWYKNMGVNSFIMFDDASTDKTADLLEKASDFFDITLKVLPYDSGSHVERQSEAYREVLRTYKDKFDWIGFFDSDEFLNINSGINIHSFLDMSDEIGAVAINWCNYGSSGHVIKPKSPPFLAYTRHSEVSSAINRHVKSFVRPKLWSGKWVNVHYFDVGSYRYVDPSREDVVWSKTPGIIASNPKWYLAKIMHYQCRSMEHFIDRAKKRKDITITANDWINLDQNSIEELVEVEKANKVKNIMQEAKERIFNNIIKEKINTKNIIPADFDDILIFELKRFDGFDVVVNEGGEVSSKKQGKKEELLYGFLHKKNPNNIYFFTTNEKVDLAIKQDDRARPVLRYKLNKKLDDEKNSFFIQHPITEKFISAEPISLGGEIVCNRHDPSDWESFELIEVADQDKFEVFRKKRFPIFLLSSEYNRDKNIDPNCSLFFGKYGETIPIFYKTLPRNIVSLIENFLPFPVEEVM